MIPTYAEHFHTIMRGVVAAPRGEVVHQVYNAIIIFRAGEMPGRTGINQKIGLMEGFQFIGGFFDRDFIKTIAPKARLELFTEQAAYGPRTASQLQRAWQAMREDEQTRRAQIVMPRPNEVGSASLPCTTSIQFHVRPRTPSTPARLNATVVMRSSDAVWGLPYDIVQFGMLVQAMANCLTAVEPGQVTLFIGNAHVYDATQHLVPDDARGGSFSVTRKFSDWTRAQDWGVAQAHSMQRAKPLEGIIINADHI